MSQVRIVPARLGHALQVARQLDPSLLKLALDKGVDPRRVMRTRFRQSREVKALLLDGKPIAIGGWSGTLLGGPVLAWLALTPKARKHWRPLVRAVLEERDRLKACGLPVSAEVNPDDKKGRRFAEFCGLKLVETGPMLTMVG